jgi:FkbM family methyltransferase
MRAAMSLKFSYLYRAYRYRLRDDPAELRFLCQSLSRGQVAVDIGAYKGAYSYWMRRRVGPSGAVFAFEPQPAQVEYLRAVFSAMHYDNVEAVPKAVSDKCGTMMLHVPSGSGKSQKASLESLAVSGDSKASVEREPNDAYPVDVTTLDSFFASRSQGPNFLKIDVEGHELAVLKTGVKTLQTFRPTILLECEARHRPDHDVGPVFELLESLGYAGTFFFDRARRPLAEFDPAVHQRLDPPDPVFLPPGYVNNFAFVP